VYLVPTIRYNVSASVLYDLLLVKSKLADVSVFHRCGVCLRFVCFNYFIFFPLLFSLVRFS